jgi:hypothetical protein
LLDKLALVTVLELFEEFVLENELELFDEFALVTELEFPDEPELDGVTVPPPPPLPPELGTVQVNTASIKSNADKMTRKFLIFPIVLIS